MDLKMLAVGVLAGACLVVVAKSATQTAQQQTGIVGLGDARAAEPDIDLLRQDIRAKKQQLIGENLSLSETEATKLWPVYRRYAEDLRGINDEKFRLIKEYAQNWSDMSDQDALIYIRRWLEVDAKVQDLRLTWTEPLF